MACVMIHHWKPNGPPALPSCAASPAARSSSSPSISPTLVVLAARLFRRGGREFEKPRFGTPRPGRRRVRRDGSDRVGSRPPPTALDGFFEAFCSRPEPLLDPDRPRLAVDLGTARAGRVADLRAASVAGDLESGPWDEEQRRPAPVSPATKARYASSSPENPAPERLHQDARRSGRPRAAGRGEGKLQAERDPALLRRGAGLPGGGRGGAARATVPPAMVGTAAVVDQQRARPFDEARRARQGDLAVDVGRGERPGARDVTESNAVPSSCSASAGPFETVRGRGRSSRAAPASDGGRKSARRSARRRRRRRTSPLVRGDGDSQGHGLAGELAQVGAEEGSGSSPSGPLGRGSRRASPGCRWGEAFERRVRLQHVDSDLLVAAQFAFGGLTKSVSGVGTTVGVADS